MHPDTRTNSLMQLTTILGFAAAMVFPAIAGSQSLLDRPPNMSGDWAGASGTLYFHFAHRFATSSAPERKVSNVPTFLVAAGLPRRLLAGFNYSTNSTLAPRFPNEWEVFARWMPLLRSWRAARPGCTTRIQQRRRWPRWRTLGRKATRLSACTCCRTCTFRSIRRGEPALRSSRRSNSQSEPVLRARGRRFFTHRPRLDGPGRVERVYTSRYTESPHGFAACVECDAHHASGCIARVA